MKLLVYILREYFKYVLGTLMLCQFLFILFDFMHKSTGYFARYDVAAETIFLFYFYQLPLQFVQILPITAMIASIVSMMVLSRNNEITAMRAAGCGPFALAIPFAIGGMVLSFLSFFIGETILPYSAQKMHYVESVLIEGHDTLGLNEKNNWIKAGNSLLHFGRYDYQSKEILDLKIVNLSNSFLARSTVFANSAVYQEASGMWLLKDLLVWHWEGDRLIEKKRRPDWLVSLPIDAKKLKADRRRPDEMALWEISDLIEQGQKFSRPVISLKIAWHTKIAYSLAAFLVSFLGLKFGFKSERSTEMARSVLLALGVGISYWFVLSACRALGGTGSLPPVLAAWLPDIGLLFIIGLQILRLERK